MYEFIAGTLDAGAFFHDVLFSFQRAQKLYHGARGNNFVLQSTLNFLAHLETEGKIGIQNSNTYEEAIMEFSNYLQRCKVIKSFSLEEIEDDKYTLRVEGCVFSGRVHKFINTSGATCPYAIIAMALYNKFKGKASSEKDSTYFIDGTQTIIEPSEFEEGKKRFLRDHPLLC